MNSTSSHLTPVDISFAGVDPFLSLAVVAGVVSIYMIYLMLRPLFEEGEISADEWNQLEDDSMALLRQRDRVIAELKEIEFEAAMNKLDDRDLTQLRGQYEREALRLIGALEDESAEYAEQLGSTRPKKPQAQPEGSSNMPETSPEESPEAIEADVTPEESEHKTSEEDPNEERA